MDDEAIITCRKAKFPVFFLVSNITQLLVKCLGFWPWLCFLASLKGLTCRIHCRPYTIWLNTAFLRLHFCSFPARSCRRDRLFRPPQDIGALQRELSWSTRKALKKQTAKKVKLKTSGGEEASLADNFDAQQQCNIKTLKHQMRTVCSAEPATQSYFEARFI